MKHWHTVIILFTMFLASLLLTGCLGEDDRNLLKEEWAKYQGLKEQLNNIMADAREGKISVSDVQTLVSATKLQMEHTWKTMEDIKSRGGNFWEIVLTAILGGGTLGTLFRGIPSKGLGRALINGVTARKPEGT